MMLVTYSVECMEDFHSKHDTQVVESSHSKTLLFCEVMERMLLYSGSICSTIHGTLFPLIYCLDNSNPKA